MALIPPPFLNTLVAIGEITREGFQCDSTGFLYGTPIPGRMSSNGQQLYHPFLVTNRHVVEPNRKLVARFNLSAGPASEPKTLDQDWTLHPTGADVAVTQIDPDFIISKEIEYSIFLDSLSLLDRRAATEAGISEGSGVFVLGFPLQLAGRERNYVIVRQGIFARIQDWLRGDESTFLIDASIFPGNSGGPVLTKPEVISVEGTSSFAKCSLIGMVSSYIPYQEVAISAQTKSRE